jgi:superfamily II DNA or RNA helicase
MLRDRQMAGKRRIVVYSASTVMLEIARNYMARAGGCGRLFLFKGSMDASDRENTIRAFLSDDNPKGVLFMSSAGSVGVTLCPGCETLFVVGDVPWNNAELKQAIGRVHRISQTKPVEVVTFVPRRSVTAAKLKAHEDKRDRLEPAMRDEDFSNFTAAEESQWKLRAQITMSLSILNATGNYKMTAEQAHAYAVWQSACLAATAAGQPHPACPAECMLPTPLRANDVVLPPVSYPVEGFVEPSVASGSKRSMDSDSDSDSDEEIEYSKFNGKRRMIDSSSEPLTVEARLKMLRELTGANANSSSDEETENDDDDDEDETEEEDGDDEDE